MSSSSASAFVGLVMSTSGSMIGTSPASRIWRPSANCWATTASTPARSALATTERIFVPNTPLATARASRSSSPGIGFINWAPSTSSARPLSTLRNGTTPLSSQRKAGVSLPSTVRSIVISKRIAPSTLSPLKLGLVMIRLRISWMRSNMSSSEE